MVKEIFTEYLSVLQLSLKGEILSKKFTPDRGSIFSFIYARVMCVLQLVVLLVNITGFLSRFLPESQKCM